MIYLLLKCWLWVGRKKYVRIECFERLRVLSLFCRRGGTAKGFLNKNEIVSLYFRNNILVICMQEEWGRLQNLEIIAVATR